ncbi:MAG TPA: hypothetical protein VIX41_11280 [Acidimicrobiales bacterium]|jgi:hypothetical protein
MTWSDRRYWWTLAAGGAVLAFVTAWSNEGGLVLASVAAVVGACIAPLVLSALLEFTSEMFVLVYERGLRPVYRWLTGDRTDPP